MYLVYLYTLHTICIYCNYIAQILLMYYILQIYTYPNLSYFLQLLDVWEGASSRAFSMVGLYPNGWGVFLCGDLSWKSTGGQVSYKNDGLSPWGLRLNSSMRASRARTWGPITSALFFKIDESKWNKWLNDIKTDCWTTSESQTKCKFYYITCYSWLAEILKNRSVRSV